MSLAVIEVGIYRKKDEIDWSCDKFLIFFFK